MEFSIKSDQPIKSISIVFDTTEGLELSNTEVPKSTNRGSVGAPTKKFTPSRLDTDGTSTVAKSVPVDINELKSSIVSQTADREPAVSDDFNQDI